MRRFSPLFALPVLAALVNAPAAYAQRPAAPVFSSDEVLVEMRAPSGANRDFAAVTRSLPGAQIERSFPASGWAKVKLPAGEAATAENLARLSQSLGGARVTLNYRRHFHTTTPNDNGFGNQWGLTKIAAPKAWDVTTGSPNVVVATIDTGVATAHGDLAANLWTNPGESGNGKATNGVDDDGDGYVDDVHGINAISDSGDVEDDIGHGTHVAGIIGAVGNNTKAVAGVNWNVKIMALKFLDASGNGFDADAIQCLEYVIAQKKKGVNVRIVNCSWGGPEDNPALEAEFKAASDAGLLLVCSAGNGGNDTVGDDNDTTPDYPSSYTESGIVSVAASDTQDNLAGFSNYGATSVDLAAPGTSILSLAYGGGTAYMSGTSMAAPFVSGAAALLLAKQSNLTAAQLKSRILDSVEKLPQLNGKCVSGGRLNLNRAIRNAIYQISGNVFRVNAANVQIPLVGARIYANDALLTSTDKDGNYTMGSLPAGTYTITVKLGGFTFNAKSVTLPQVAPAVGAPNAVRNFQGTATGSVYNVTGHAYNRSGDPTAGISIYWNGLAVPVAVTDSSGAYIIKQRTTGTFTLSASGGDLDWTASPSSITLPTTGSSAPNGIVDFQGKTPDTTPPILTITKPASNATVNGNSFVAKGTATDPSGVAATMFILYRFSNSGTQYYDWLKSAWTTDTDPGRVVKEMPASGATSVSWELTLPNLPADSYRLLSWGRDMKGNESTGSFDTAVDFKVTSGS